MNKLRTILLVFAFLALPFVNMRAVDWMPVLGDDTVVTESAVNENYNYLIHGGDILTADGETNGSFYAAEPADDEADVLNIDGTLDGEGETPCSLKVDGDIYIDATDYDATVNILSEVTFEPHCAVCSSVDAAGEGAQLIFNAPTGATITVNMDYNMTFKSHTTLGGEDDANIDLTVSFVGGGRTIFNMYGGTSVSFMSDGPDEGGAVTYALEGGVLTPTYPVVSGDYPYAFSNEVGKVKVFVTMDQEQADVTLGQNKLLFQRVGDSEVVDEVDTATEYAAYNAMIYLGTNSVFTYVSDNYDGTSSEDYVAGGYASVAVDPSNVWGVGRTVLFIEGAYTTDDDGYITKRYPFNDGALVVAGHFVSNDGAETLGFDAAALRTANADTGYDFSQPAGLGAYFRVIDDVFYQANVDLYGSYPADWAADYKQGLLVINNCQNHGKLASDPYLDRIAEGYIGYDWAYANNIGTNVRTGCVLGVNGVFEVYDGTFLDYAADSTNQFDAVAAADNNFGGVDAELDDTTSMIKMRNPSAFIVDGLSEDWLNDEAADPVCYYEVAREYSSDAGDGQGASVMQAYVDLYGNAQLHFKDVASSEYGYSFNLFALPDAYWLGGLVDDVVVPAVDYTASLALNELDETGLYTKLAYDGYQLANNDQTKQNEGEHVVDVEGRGTVATYVLDGFYVDPYLEELEARDYSGYAPATVPTAAFTLDSILIDSTGREVLLDNTNTATVYSYITRPLSTSDEYARYNSPALFINHRLSFFNTIYNHSDATKWVNGLPDYSEPAITGGERLYYVANEDSAYPSTDVLDADRYRSPEFRLFNSELKLQESLAASGVRFVAMDDPLYNTSTDGDNLSYITFYDHGKALDERITGHGRLFVLGSALNGMGWSDAANFVTATTYLNVFKHNKPVDTSGSTVTLKLVNNAGYSANDRSQHFILSSLPSSTLADAGAQTGIFLGWPTTHQWANETLAVPTGDEASFPYLGETITSYAAEDDVAAAEAAGTIFRLDALHATLPATPAELVIAGKYINFSGYDVDGNTPYVPVKDDYASGNINVNWGGKFSAAAAAITRSGLIDVSSIINTNVTQRPWGDYDEAAGTRLTWFSGQVSLPSDQVSFGDGYGIQQYGLSTSMFTYAAINGINYARLTGSDTMSFAWNLRDPLLSSIIISSETTPLTPPTYLMYVGAGDIVREVNVSGATSSDPFYFDVSGDGVRAKIAEVNAFRHNVPTNIVDRVAGEGAHALLFLEYGGRIGLGATAQSSSTDRAWDILGQDYVAICPLGNGVVDVNSDLIVADDLPLIASTLFGASEVQRITFKSTTEHEIRIPTGVTLDLSTFGQNTRRQEIAFGGKLKLVFEKGASIRFPSAASVVGGVVLYMNDESEIIFEGINDGITTRYLNEAETGVDFDLCNVNRSKIVGKGQIWLNKNAKLKVMGTAAVGVQSDVLEPATSLVTDITISLQRQSQFLIGDENIAGGVFEVGNPVATTGASVSFRLALDGTDALFHTDREGFFGLGAGILDKVASNPNGAAWDDNPKLADGKAELTEGLPTFLPDYELTAGTAWRVVPLYNVKSIAVGVTNGIIEHNKIVDGSSNQASLWALGQLDSTLTDANYTFSIGGINNAIIRGGGNVMYIPATAPTNGIVTTGLGYFTVNVWDYAGAGYSNSGANGTNGEMYSILASAPLILDRHSDLIDSAVVSFADFGTTGGRVFTATTAAAAADLVSFKSYGSQTAAKKVTLGKTQFDIAVGYVNTAPSTSQYYDATHTLQEIVRQVNPAVIPGSKASDGLNLGILMCQESVSPVSYFPLQQK